MLSIGWIRKVIHGIYGVEINVWEFVHYNVKKYKLIDVIKTKERIISVLNVIITTPFTDQTELLYSYHKDKPDISQLLFTESTKKNFGRKNLFMNTINAVHLSKIDNVLHIFYDITIKDESMNICEYIVTAAGVMQAFANICEVELGTITICSVNVNSTSSLVLAHSQISDKYFKITIDEEGLSYRTLGQLDSINFDIKLY